MFTLIGITKDDEGTQMRVCGTFEELGDARAFMNSEWWDGFKEEREWTDDPDRIVGVCNDWHAWIRGGDLYEESRWAILDPVHNPTFRM